jgi:hypothetical protein
MAAVVSLFGLVTNPHAVTNRQLYCPAHVATPGSPAVMLDTHQHNQSACRVGVCTQSFEARKSGALTLHVTSEE